jgi:ABC-type glycerol-3-phosphate transport system permease component
MRPDKTSPNARGDAADDEKLPEFHPSALRTGVFRVLTGLSSLLMGWALWNSFSWGLLLLVCIVAYHFIPFTLMGYDAQRFFDAVGDRVRRVVYYGVPRSPDQ